MNLEQKKKLPGDSINASDNEWKFCPGLFSWCYPDFVCLITLHGLIIKYIATIFISQVNGQFKQLRADLDGATSNAPSNALH